MNRQFSTPVGFTIILIVGLLGVVYFRDTRQQRMNLGLEILPAITNRVYSHSEFNDVRIVVQPIQNEPCFVITGMVASRSQLSTLQNVITAAAPRPPLDIVYIVKVLKDHPEGSVSEQDRSK